MTKKTSHWVTIPEETVHTPVSKKKKKSADSMPAKNKIFWGAGFVVLVIFTFALLAPTQMATILQGNLFDQGLTVVPEGAFEDPQSSTVQEEVTEEDIVKEVAEEVEVEPEIDLAVEPVTEAVSIQIDPVATEEKTDEEVVEAEAEVVTEEPEEELDANQKLLEELSQQVADLKEKDEEKTKIIEDLATMVEEEELHSSAEVTPAVTATTTIGSTTTGYKVNTHTVTMTPHEALAINTAQYQSAQATVAAGGVTAADYSAQLSSADGTPESGPKEAMLLALTLTFIALLGWKMRKISRA